jgi:hypothetical protein
MRQHRHETAKYLVRRGANLDAKDESGATPRSLAGGDAALLQELEIAASRRKN